jgi:uncharacterized HAD superfamily protein
VVLVAIDVDSTLHDYWSQLSAAALKRFGVALPYELQHGWEIGALSDSQLAQVIDDTHADATIGAGIAYPGAAEVVTGWQRAGHRILITTHRRETAWSATAQWLDANGIPFDDLRCGYRKVEHLHEVRADLLVDDSPENLELALAGGIAVATIRHPWNVRLIEREPSIIEAADWPGLGAALSSVLER